MANELNEMEKDLINPDGHDIGVIEKQIEIKVNKGSKAFEIILWCLLVVPGLVFLFKKIKAKNFLDKLQQRIQSAASEIDNSLEQRVQVLENAAALINKSTELDKDVMKGVAKYRSGIKDDTSRNDAGTSLETLQKQINLAFESYPDLKSQSVIADAMQKNDYLQQQITATRTNYNDLVSLWNQQIQIWPTKKIVAAKYKMTTRIPFSISSEVKEKSKSVFF